MPCLSFLRASAPGAIAGALMLGSVSCSGLYYDTMEAFGEHKRDLLVDRVSDARDEQVEAKDQFESALEAFVTLVDAPNSDLRRVYDELNEQLGRSESKASGVKRRIESIEKVGGDLFAEWEGELADYTNESLRERSRETMVRTRERYDQMVVAMKRPEKTMEDVLVAFRDHVLFLKHNLNAQAVASLQGTVESLELDIAGLVDEMESAIAEADAFIDSMDAGPGIENPSET